MNKKLQSLVRKYKTFFEIKTRSEYTNKKLIIQWQTVIAFFILMATGLFIGIITNQLENLYYVFFFMNTVIIGSFVLNKVSFERKMMDKMKTHYDYTPELVYQLSTIIGIMSIGQVLYIIFYTNVRLYIPIVVLLLLFSLVSQYLTRYLFKQYIELEPHRTIRNGLYVFLLLIISRYLYVFGPPSYAYMFSMLTILVIYLIKTYVTLLPDKVQEYSIIISVISVISLFVLYNLNTNENANEIMFSLNGDNLYLESVNSNYEYDALFDLYETETGEYGFESYETFEYLYMVSTINGFIIRTDHNYKNLEIIDYSDINIPYNHFYVEHDLLKFRFHPSGPQTETEGVYVINNDLSIQFVQPTTVKPGTVAGIYEKNNEYYSVFSTRDYDTYEVSYEVKVMNENGVTTTTDITDIGPNEVIFETSESVLLRKDNTLEFHSYMFSNGYLLTTEDNGLSNDDEIREYPLYEISDYLSDESSEVIYCSDCKITELTINGSYRIFSGSSYVYEENSWNLIWKDRIEMSKFYSVDGEYLGMDLDNLSRYELLGDRIYFNDVHIMDSDDLFESNYLALPNTLRNTSIIYVLLISCVGNVIVLPGTWWRYK